MFALIAERPCFKGHHGVVLDAFLDGLGNIGTICMDTVSDAPKLENAANATRDDGGPLPTNRS
jgi:hypothetical protein